MNLENLETKVSSAQKQSGREAPDLEFMNSAESITNFQVVFIFKYHKCCSCVNASVYLLLLVKCLCQFVVVISELCLRGGGAG